MFKKSIILVLITSLILLMSVVSFSEDGENEYVNIINPEVGESGKIISDMSLFFSIFVIQDVELTLDLIKIDTPVFVFEEEAELLKEEVLFIEEDKIIEEVVVEEIIVEEEEKVLASSIEEEVKEINVEFFDEVPKVLSKEQISLAYQNAQEIHQEAKDEYYNALELAREIPNVLDELAENFDPTYELSEDDNYNLEKVDSTYKSYNDSIVEYNYWEKEYLSLFEIKVLSDLNIDVDPLLPYFEYTVNDVEEGTYKLVIKLKETNEVVEVLQFELVTEENLVEEISDDIFAPIDLFDAIIDLEEVE